MLTEGQIKAFREFLDNSQNPVFFFDNDVDGLASFLLLRRYCKKGKGIAIKTFPALDANYSRKLHELNPDYAFILDKPIVADEFIEEAKKLNIKIIWLDHHPPSKIDASIEYFNPLLNKPESNEPVSYWCYKIVDKKEDVWIALLGCLADWFIPEFAEEFSKENSGLLPATKEPAKALYETELGKIAKMLSFALKDRTSNVVRMLKSLIEIKNPRELLDENSKTAPILKRFRVVNRKYTKLLERAKSIGIDVLRKNKKLLFFRYGGELSMSGELANEIYYYFPEKIIVVAYVKGTKVNCSIRGKIDVRKIVAEALNGIESTSGGHEHACGATLQIENLSKFRDNLIRILE